MNYYNSLFTSANPRAIEESTSVVERKVTPAMASKLLNAFTMEEVAAVVNQMGPLKAPGSDGYTVGFYQQHWATMGPKVCEAELHFFNSSVMDLAINMTHVALIPKNNNPLSVLDYRPISLCNVMYKIISKVLANRLKEVLPHIISPFQSAFLSGRLITDNILAAYETFHTMHTHMWSKVGYMGIKLDMSKAYDRVEWAFLESVMNKMGFPARWIQLIMECVRTITYALLLNGHLMGHIILERGSRHGDPLSPYLFLICAKSLNAMLSKVEKNGVFTRVPTSKKGPRISHLVFMDDNLLFCNANSAEWRRLTKILDKYEMASG